MTKIETKQWTRTDIDRSLWGPGDWDGEPDKKQWSDPATGLPCLAVRHPSFGNWCGYVGVMPGHPWHGKDWSEVDASVHGGVNFANECMRDIDESRGVCHIGPEGVWWLGFDCCHAGDRSPGLEVKLRSFNMRDNSLERESYKTLAYVESECADLARQAVDVMKI